MSLFKNKKLWITLLSIGALLGMIGYWYAGSMFEKNVAKKEDYTLLIPSGAGFDDVVAILESDTVLINSGSFKRAAQLMKYQKDEVPSGRFIVKPSMTNRDLIGKLRSRKQDASKVTFNSVRTSQELAGALSKFFEADSMAILAALRDSIFLDSLELSDTTILTKFIPNTYEMYWTTTPENAIKRLVAEGDKFWEQEGRKEKLATLGMTYQEVYTLASIVEKETNLKSERATLAGVYLNRLRMSMPLQADPTVVFATGDFGLKRVLEKHLKMDSPYNTYANVGLPPGPIYMPSIHSIDAVLANQQHDFVFFCAKPGYDGGHTFAKTFNEHTINANNYRDWLDKENIK